MSGSIGDAQARDFLSEIKGIMQQYQNFNIKVFCFDTKVYNEADYDGFSIDDFDEYQPMGGGGTDFDVNWDYMKEHDIVPKKFIMFTDGYPCGSWGDENYCDTVFILSPGFVFSQINSSVQSLFNVGIINRFICVIIGPTPTGKVIFSTPIIIATIA